jgi:proline iminopeptidase
MRFTSLISVAAMALTTVATQAQSHEGSFMNAGLKLHYTMEGTGAPVLILAGGPGLDAGYMQPVAELVAKHHTAILLDQRGTTGSMPEELNPTTISPDLYISDLEALRTALHYDRWTLLGHSAGTGTAMMYATRHPEHTASLILLATVPPTSGTVEHMDENMLNRLPAEAQQQVHAVFIGKLAPDAQFAAVARILNPAYFYDQKIAQQFLAGMRPDYFHEMTARLLQKSGTPYDYTTDLKQLYVATTIIQGRQDLLDLGMANDTRNAIPGAKLIVIERCGHFGWLDNPADFNVALESALAQPLH